MRNQYDIAVYAPQGPLVLIGEVKAMKDVSESSAIYFRRNLLSHGLLSNEPYFMLVYRGTIFLWRPNASPEQSPDFHAATKPVLERFLGEISESDSEIGEERLLFAIKSWLSEFTHDFRTPTADSPADKMLLDADLYSRLKGGEVKRGFAV